VVVGADGTPPARAAGRGLPRLLRTVIVTAGLVALGWLLSCLLGTGAAAAESTADTGSPGLLGGLVGGITGVLGGTVSTPDTGSTAPLGGRTHLLGAPAAVAPARPPGDTQPAPVNPIVPAPAAPAPAVQVRAHPPAATGQPAPTAKPDRAAAAHRSTRVTAAFENAAPAGQLAPTTGGKAAPDPAPTVPAAPTSSVSAGHDGPGQARGGAFLPAGPAPAAAPPGPHAGLGRVGLAGSRTAGLPALSPD